MDKFHRLTGERDRNREEINEGYIRSKEEVDEGYSCAQRERMRIVCGV